MGWRGFIDDRRKTVFFWSQKAACTTLFNLLADNLDPRPTSKNFFHKQSSAYPKCLAAIEQQDYRSVILVRHPVTRVISAYFNKFCIYRDTPLKQRDQLEAFAQVLFDRYCESQQIETTQNIIPFEGFLETIALMQSTKPLPDRPINGHWETQFPHFLAKRGFEYDHILRVESFDQDMAALAPKLGLTFHPRTMNKTKIAEEPYKGYLGCTPAQDVTDYAFGYQNFLNDWTKNRIHEIYAVDFERFGYAPLPDNLMNGTARG